jgi:biotin-dependent carboxylase-like uncharacterized protein
LRNSAIHMSLRVIEPGLYSALIDAGRPRTRELGVPVGGPADGSAWEWGNALLGNPRGAPALEITLVGPVLEALARTGAVVFGAPFSLSTSRGRLLANRTFTLEVGEELHIGGTPCGARAYLCVTGGFQAPVILGSQSALGPIRRGEELVCHASAVRARHVGADFARPLIPALSDVHSASARTLRVLPGPEADWFAVTVADLREGSAWASFSVRPESNRMGVRLAGQPLPVPDREMTSQPVAPGAMQVTRDGQIIVLGVDGQTIGGYPRIGHVVSADLDLIGQLRPGDRVSFQTATLAEAVDWVRAQRARMAKCLIRLREACKAI